MSASAAQQLEDLVAGMGQPVAEGPDSVSETVGRPGYVEDHVEDECVVPSDDVEGRDEPAVFDRYYFPVDGAEPVLVDLLSVGSDVERREQEAWKHVALKRRWCEARGVRYEVVGGDTPAFHF
ncbi:MAG: hypothetical protein ABSH36_07765 [Solirubrobacteraceae bacterium]